MTRAALRKAVVGGEPYRIAPDGTVYRLTQRGELRAVPKRVQVWVLQEYNRQSRSRKSLPDRMIEAARRTEEEHRARRERHLAFLKRRRRRRILAGALIALGFAAACYVAWMLLSQGGLS